MTHPAIEAQRGAEGCGIGRSIETITPTEAAELRARQDRNAAWSEQYRKPNGWTVITAEEQATCPDDARITNEERGKLDHFETRRDKPQRLFAYVKQGARGAGTIAVTTWTGDVLGYGTHGREYRDNFGGVRVPIWFRMDGADYSGTFYKSAGDYCRARKMKAKG